MASFLNLYALRSSPLTTKVLTAVLFTFFLFYIDEGYYNLSWTRQLWNWVFFAVYAGSMVAGQVMIDRFLLKKFRDEGSGILNAIIGIPLGIILLFSVGFTLKYFLS